MASIQTYGGYDGMAAGSRWMPAGKAEGIPGISSGFQGSLRGHNEDGDADSAYGSCYLSDAEVDYAMSPPSTAESPVPEGEDSSPWSTNALDDCTPDAAIHPVDQAWACLSDQAPGQDILWEQDTSIFAEVLLNPWQDSTTPAAGSVADSGYSSNPSDAGSETTYDGRKEPPNASRSASMDGFPNRGGKRAVSVDEDEDDEGGAGHKRVRPFKPEAIEERWLACPYLKKYYGTAAISKSCLAPGFSNISKLEDHLLKIHSLSGAHCPCGMQDFNNEEELAQHERVTACPGPSNPTSRFDRQQQDRLVQVPEKSMSEEDKWRAIWQILFPGEDVPSPYCDECDQKSVFNGLSPQIRSASDIQDLLTSAFEAQHANWMPAAIDMPRSLPNATETQASDCAVSHAEKRQLVRTEANSSPRNSSNGQIMSPSRQSTHEETRGSSSQAQVAAVACDADISPLQQCQASLSNILPYFESPELSDLVGGHVTSKNREVFARVLVALKRLLNLDEESSDTVEDDQSLDDDASSMAKSSDLGSQGTYLSFGPSSFSGSSWVSHPSHEGREQKRDRAGRVSCSSGKNRRRSSAYHRRNALPPIGSDDETNEENNKLPRRLAPRPGSGIARRFACPYHKAFPSIPPRAASCQFPGFSSTTKVKEHLYRRHKLPDYHCYLCFADFPDSQALGEHLRTTSGESQCPGFGQRPDMTFTHEQETELRRRSERIPEDEKWRIIFRILFEGRDDLLANMPSPYIDEPTSQISSADVPRHPDSETSSPSFPAIDHALRTQLLNLTSHLVQSHLNRQAPVVAENIISRLPSFIDEARAHMMRGNQPPSLHAPTEQPPQNSASAMSPYPYSAQDGSLHMGDLPVSLDQLLWYASSVPDMNSPSSTLQLQHTAGLQAEPGYFDSSDFGFGRSTAIPHQMAYQAQPSSETALPGAYYNTFGILGAGTGMGTSFPQTQYPNDWNTSFDPRGNQSQSWNPVFPPAHSSGQGNPVAYHNNLRAPNAFGSATNIPGGFFHQQGMILGNQTVPAPLQGYNTTAFGAASASGNGQAFNTNVNGSSGFNFRTPQDLNVHNGPASSTLGTAVTEYGSRSSQHRDVESESTQATTAHSDVFEGSKE